MDHKTPPDIQQPGRDSRCRCSPDAIAGWGNPDTHLSACPLYIAFPDDFSAEAASKLRNVQCRHDDALRALDTLRDKVRFFLSEWDNPRVGNPHFEIDALRRATGESGPIVAPDAPGGWRGELLASLAPLTPAQLAAATRALGGVDELIELSDDALLERLKAVSPPPALFTGLLGLGRGVARKASE